MKIALIHNRLLRKGGLETRLFSYMNYLVSAGHQVALIVYKIGDDVVIPDGVEIIPIPLKYVPKPLRPTLMDKLLQKIRKQHRFDFILSLTRTTACDAILAPGTHLGFLAAQNKRHSFQDKLVIKVEQSAFNSGNTILAASKIIRTELLTHYHANPDDIQLLYPPIDDARFHMGLREKRAEFRGKYGFHSDKTAFVFVSASHNRKGLPILLEVFKALKDQPYELFVAGDKVQKTNLLNVTFLGFIAETEELYAAADYSLLPANYEPFGQVVAESVMCGAPVIISDKVGAKEVISEKEGIVISNLDPKAWVDVLQNLKQDQFDISPNFAQEKQIRLKDHMAVILDLAKQSVK